MNYPSTDDLNAEGKFTDGDPVAGITPSVSSANYMNAVYDELIGVIESAGIAADENKTDQLITALKSLFLERETFAIVGAVFYFASEITPEGFLRADGSEVRRTEFSNLFAFAETSGNIYTDGTQQKGQFSYGATEGYFRLPDLRGEFIRGLDDDRVLGDEQEDAIRNIVGQWGRFTSATSMVEPGSVAGAFYKDGKVQLMAPNQAGTVSYPLDIFFDASRVVPTADENRPRNIALAAFIKY